MAAGRTGTILHRLAERTEELSLLDGPIESLRPGADAAIRRFGLKEALSGTWLGHPLHPLATDVVIGPWAMAAVLDVSGDRHSPAAERLLGLGVLAALPTAASGLSDWSDMTGRRTGRMGLVHAAGNLVALTLNTTSYIARKGGRRDLGRRLTAASVIPLGISGFLGAHLAYARGVGVNRTAFDDEPGRCTHCGAPLQAGESGEAVCPRDGSRFRDSDGAVLRGPATTPAAVPA
jgi:uncharacterized membrane protein